MLNTDLRFFPNIIEHGNNMYTLETDMDIMYGYANKEDGFSATKLELSFYKPTNTVRNKNSKTFKSDEQYFFNMIKDGSYNR